jgi:carboxyl-terminal processing protease
VSDFYDKVVGKGILNQFAITWTNKHRDAMHERFPTAADYARDYKLEDAVWNDFLAYADSEGVPYDAEEAAPSVERLREFITAMIARNLWDIEAYFMVVNKNDPGFLRALETMKDGTFEAMKIAAR